jgi:hypothetical protein
MESPRVPCHDNAAFKSIIRCTMLYRSEFTLIGWEILSNGQNVGQRKLIVHVDNAPVHHSKMTQNFLEHRTLMKFTFLLNWAHISPLDFYLLEKRKNALIWQQIPDEIDLLEIMTRIVDWMCPKHHWCKWRLHIRVNILIKIILLQVSSFINDWMTDQTPYIEHYLSGIFHSRVPKSRWPIPR